MTKRWKELKKTNNNDTEDLTKPIHEQSPTVTSTDHNLPEHEKREMEDRHEVEIERKDQSEEQQSSSEEDEEEESENEEEEDGKEDEEPLIISDGVKEEILEYEKTFLVQDSEEVTPFSITLWDLGGQNEFMATHHMFLNVETTSLIVMDITKSLDDPVGKDPKSGHPNTALEILRYWLNAFQVETIEKKRKPNIAIVLTHKDVIEATKENPEVYIQS